MFHGEVGGWLAEVAAVAVVEFGDDDYVVFEDVCAEVLVEGVDEGVVFVFCAVVVGDGEVPGSFYFGHPAYAREEVLDDFFFFVFGEVGEAEVGAEDEEVEVHGVADGVVGFDDAFFLEVVEVGAY